MNILLFGAPGAGKGTQSALLVSKLGMKHISTGDLFRAAIKNSTPLGKEAKKFIDQGKLVPDTVTIGMVDEVLGDLDGKPFILDGFPRNVSQAVALDKLLKQHDLEVEKAIFLEVARDAIISRLSGRRLCKNCGAVYHIEFSPPKKEGVCDKCGKGPIYQRDDDKKEAIATRLDVYEDSTKPLKEHYRKQGKVTEVDGEGEPEEVFSRVKPQLEI